MTHARYNSRIHKDNSAGQTALRCFSSAKIICFPYSVFLILIYLFSSCFHMRIFTLFFAIGRNHINRRRFFVMFTKKKKLSNFCFF